MTVPGWCRREGDALVLVLHVQPRASRDEVVGPQGDRLKVRVTAAPVEGAANDHLARFLAQEFAVPRSQVEVVAGHASREKRVAIRSPRRPPQWLPPACWPGAGG